MKQHSALVLCRVQTAMVLDALCGELAATASCNISCTLPNGIAIRLCVQDDEEHSCLQANI